MEKLWENESVGPLWALSPEKVVLPFIKKTKLHKHTHTHTQKIFVFLLLSFMSVIMHHLVSKFLMCTNLPDDRTMEANPWPHQMFLGNRRKPRSPFCPGFSMTNNQLFLPFITYPKKNQERRKFCYLTYQSAFNWPNMPTAKRLTRLSETFHLISNWNWLYALP